MTYKKEYFRDYESNSMVFRIYSRHYDCTLQHVSNMWHALLNDFHKISPNEIEVHKFGGDRLRGIVFLEIATAPNTLMAYPPDYIEVGKLEVYL